MKLVRGDVDYYYYETRFCASNQRREKRKCMM